MAGFMFSLKLSGLAALLVASPFIFSQVWLFVAPGLYAKEKKVVIPFVVVSSILFLGGRVLRASNRVSGDVAVLRELRACRAVSGAPSLPARPTFFPTSTRRSRST